MSFRSLLTVPLAPLLAAVALIGGCQEQHPAAAVGAPEHLHDALGGDPAAQDWVAGCYAAGGGCGTLSADPPLSCAWRGVRLANTSPTRSLAHAEAFVAACSGLDRMAEQRASVAFADLTTRVSHADLDELNTVVAEVKTHAVLYPSAAEIRARANRQLARDRQPGLPAYGSPVRSADRRTETWSACSQQLCLEATTPVFGGGVSRYRVRSVGAFTPNAVADVAAAALEAPFMSERLAQVGRVDRAGICWTSVGDGGAFTVEAAPGPCPG